MSEENLLSPAPDPGTVDANNPWPGLAAFREDDQALFHGRERETEELLRRVLRQRVTVLYGLSGLGKTSLLQAGLFPRLRGENVLPVSIRLDYSKTGPPLTEQIRDAISRATMGAGIEVPSPHPGETLWESFHRQRAELWSQRNRPITPLLVFDQFEEIFTLGQDAEGTRETDALLAELASLCEGAPPREVRARLDANPLEIRNFQFDRHPYKVLFSLREDFLPDFEALRDRIASLAHNRMRLLGMNGENAFNVVTQGDRAERPALVDAVTAEKIVRFVASEDDTKVPLADLNVEPALLSFVCRELNNQRRFRGEAQITAELLQGTRDMIFVDFYERSVGDLDGQVRTFIEDQLLTKSGYRDSVALENIPETLTPAMIKTMTDRRLLRIEDRGGLPRIELTHDVLTRVIKTSRDTRRQREDQATVEAARLNAERRQREAREAAEAARQDAERREAEARRKLRRSRLVIAALGLLLLGVFGLAWWGWNAQRKAREALASAEIERALHSLREGNSAAALAYLAHAVRVEPDNLLARSWLTDMLVYRAWLLPRDLQKEQALQGMRFSRDSKRIVTFDEHTAWTWDIVTGRQVGPPVNQEGLHGADLSWDGGLLLAVSKSASEARARLWNPISGRQLGPLFSLGDARSLQSFHLSPNGQLVAVVGTHGSLDLYETRTGARHTPYLRPGLINEVAFSPEGTHLVVVAPQQGDVQDVITLWDIETGRQMRRPPPESPPGDGVILVDPDRHFFMPEDRVGLGPDGKSAVVRTPFGSIFSLRIIDSSSGKRLGECMVGPDFSRFEMSRDGHSYLTLLDDHSVQVLVTQTCQAVAEPIEGIAAAQISPDGSFLVTASLEGQVRLWSVKTGRAVPDWFPLHPHANRVVISPDAGKFAAFSTEEVQVWDLAGLRPLGKPLETSFDVQEARFSADGGTLAARGQEELSVWDLRTGQASTGSYKGLDSLDVSPDGERVVTGSAEGTAQIWNVKDLQHPSQILSLEGAVTKVRFRPDGQFVITASEDGTVRLWKAETGKFVGLAMRHNHPVSWAEFSPDGQRIASFAGGRRVFVWRAPSGRPEPPLLHEKDVLYARFSPDSNRMVTTTMDGAVWIWDLRTARILAGPLSLPEGRASQVVANPDGQRLAIVFPKPPEARMWSLALEPLADSMSWKGTDGWDNVQFTADGQRLITASHGDLLIWDVPLAPAQDSADLAALAEATAGFAVAENGKLAPLSHPAGRIAELRQRTEGAPLGTPAASSLIRWFLSDPWQRTIAPLSQTKVSAFIRQHLSEGTCKAFDEVENVYPRYSLPPRPHCR